MYAIYGNMDPINIPPMLAYIPYMDPMGYRLYATDCYEKMMSHLGGDSLSSLIFRPWGKPRACGLDSNT